MEGSRPSHQPALTGFLTLVTSRRGHFRLESGHHAGLWMEGALLALGTQAADFFGRNGVPVTSVEAMPYDLCLPRDCPLCAAGQPLEDAVTPARP